MMLAMIISGGQTGADQGALRGARTAGIKTGGYMAKGWLTEHGRKGSFLATYGMIECQHPGYPARTKANVEASNGTVWFGKLDTPGYIATSKAVHYLRRPFLKLPNRASVENEAEVLRDFILTYRVRVLNVAGNRESTNPGLAAHVASVIEALAKLEGVL